MKRPLLDQGLPRSSIALMTQAGWDVTHVSEIGMSRADDADILRWPRAEARIGVTLVSLSIKFRDFRQLAATGTTTYVPSLQRFLASSPQIPGLFVWLSGIQQPSGRIVDVSGTGTACSSTPRTLGKFSAATRSACRRSLGSSDPNHRCTTPSLTMTSFAQTRTGEARCQPIWKFPKIVFIRAAASSVACSTLMPFCVIFASA